MLVRALTLGWELDVVETGSNPLVNASKQYDFCAMVPMQVQNSIGKLHQIKQLIVGGGVVSETLQEKLQLVKTKVFATYGMTETVTHIAVKRLNHQQNYLDAYYQALPDIKLFIDERNCLAIAAPKVSNEFIITNDVVALVSEKHFPWLGRFDNLLNSGGLKLHPEELEDKLAKILTTPFFTIGIPEDKPGANKNRRAYCRGKEG